jgi:hypothetical protein
MCVIRIGGEQAEFLAITLLGRSHPGCTDYWDGNWLRAEVEVVAGGFRGLVYGDLRTDELVRFHEELSRLQETLRGTAEFMTLELWLTIRVIGDGKGHMTFECEVRDGPGTGNLLSCTLSYDQTFVRPMLSQLRQALREYPVLGAEDG